MDALSLRDRVAAREVEFLDALEAMVNVDCGSFSPDGVNAIADRCVKRFHEQGWNVDRLAHEPSEGEPRLGDLVIGRLRGSGTTRVLLVGHMDTVFDDGTAAERPFRVEDGIARGPGVSDMKAGLLAGFFAVQALQDEGVETFGQVTYVCNPDEEIGSPFSRPRIAELAAEHDVAFVLEGARANGDIVSARKGITDYRFVVMGRAAHAGVEPEKGRNAILEATQQLQAMAALQGRWPGVTVNVGTIAGGTRTNVVPARCEYGIDVRSPELRTLEAAEAEIERLATTPALEGTSTRVDKHAWHRPMEKGEGATRLVALAGSIAHELGFELRDAATGGASDGNTTAAAGTPTIDGLGPIGGDDHGPAEWLDVASIVPRTAMLAALIARA